MARNLAPRGAGFALSSPPGSFADHGRAPCLFARQSPARHERSEWIAKQESKIPHPPDGKYLTTE
jgi:hypothetical protein